MPKIPGVRKKGNAWYFRIQHQHRREERGPYDSAEAAHSTRLQYLNKLKSQDLVHHKMTLGEFIAFFMREHESINVRRLTMLSTKSICENHIIPSLGNKRLSDIKAHHIVEFQNAIVRNKPPATAHNTMRTLRKILNKAVEWEYIERSPFKGRIHGPPRPEYPVLTLDELFALVQKLEGRDRCIVALAGFAALRKGEVFGLRWEDFDFKANTLALSRQFVKGEVVPLKTDKCREVIPIWEYLAHVLKKWKLASGSHTWVFKGRGDKPMSGEGWHNETWKRIKKECALPARLRFHDLRHTFASIMLAGGAAPGDVQKLLRHASFKTTMDIYRHLLPGQLERNFQIFNRLSGEKSGESGRSSP